MAFFFFVTPFKNADQFLFFWMSIVFFLVLPKTIRPICVNGEEVAPLPLWRDTYLLKVLTLVSLLSKLGESHVEELQQDDGREAGGGLLHGLV